MSSSPTFLITRLSHIGDCVLTLPLVQQLKVFWPESTIYWGMESPAHKLLPHVPELDEIIQVPKGYLKSPSQVLEMRRKLRPLKIDVSLDPQSLTKSSMLGWLSGAKTRIGLGGTYQKELSGWLNNVHVDIDQSTTHLVDRTLRLLPAITKNRAAQQTIQDPQGLMDIPVRSQAIFAEGSDESRPKLNNSRSVEFQFHVPAGTAKWAKDYLQQNSWTSPPIMINPGASWASKRWVTNRFAEVAIGLFQQHGLRSMVTWAGDEEKDWAMSIVERSKNTAEMAPETSLLQLAALYQQGRIFVGCDTGPMHMAAAVGIPCAVLFGPTRPQDSGPYGPRHVALQAWYQEGGARQRRAADNLAMRDITVEQVLEACKKILAG